MDPLRHLKQESRDPVTGQTTAGPRPLFSRQIVKILIELLHMILVLTLIHSASRRTSGRSVIAPSSAIEVARPRKDFKRRR